MGLREELQRRYDRKVQETKDLELRIRENTAYLQGLQDAMRMLDREPTREAQGAGTIDADLRAGSAVAKVRDLLREAGRPLHVVDLLAALGKPVNRNAKAGLSGTLSPYVQQRRIFTRPAPNTFGLLEFVENGSADETEPPASFGTDDEDHVHVGETH